MDGRSRISSGFRRGFRISPIIRPGASSYQRQGDPRCTATALAVESEASQGEGISSDFLEKIDTKLGTGSPIGLKAREGQVMGQPLRKPLTVSVGDWSRLENEKWLGEVRERERVGHRMRVFASRAIPDSIFVWIYPPTRNGQDVGLML